jgi:hypothetical protein
MQTVRRNACLHKSQFCLPRSAAVLHGLDVWACLHGLRFHDVVVKEQFNVINASQDGCACGAPWNGLDLHTHPIRLHRNIQ